MNDNTLNIFSPRTGEAMEFELNRKGNGIRVYLVTGRRKELKMKLKLWDALQLSVYLDEFLRKNKKSFIVKGTEL